MKVILMGRMPAIGAELLRAKLDVPCEVIVMADPATVREQIEEFADAEVIVGGPLNGDIIERCQRLKLFHVFRGGVDGLGVELLPPNVQVANTFHHEIGVAEFAVAAMLVLTRRIVIHDQSLRRGDWSGSVICGEPPDQTTLSGKTAMIVGLGRIGSEIAKRARAFGLRLLAVSRRPEEPSELVDLRIGYDRWRDHLPDADYVIASCRMSPETTRLFGSNEFALMNSSAIFVNVARGAVVDDKALYEAVRTNAIAGAAADVWNEMPANPSEICYPSQYPIHEHPNVLLSPNRSSWTWQMIEDRMRDVAENVKRVASGRPIINDVREQEL